MPVTPSLLCGVVMSASAIPGDRIGQVAWASDFRLFTFSLFFSACRLELTARQEGVKW